MLRPLLVTENFPPARGGMAQSCDRIVRGLRARGVDVDVLHLGGVRSDRHERGSVIACPVEDDPAHALNLAWNTLARLPARPSHVIAFGGALPIACAPTFAAWLDLPLITLLRGNDFDTGLFTPGRGWMLRDALARSATVCVVSEDHRSKVSRLFPEQRVLRIANGIDAAAWTLHDFDRDAARAWRDVHAGGRRVIGMFGQLKQKKGGVHFLDALADCSPLHAPHLLVVGEVEPAMLERLQALPEAIGWTHVPFLDRLELLRWYAACDLVAIPSLYDGLPNVALEAGALGVPLLASTAGGLADLVDPGDPLVFAPGDAHACRHALDVALSLPDAELRALGRALQARVLRDFDQRDEARRYHALLTQTAAAPRCPVPAPFATTLEG